MRQLFAEGAFAVVFTPMFARRLETEGQTEAADFAERILAVLAATLLAISVLAHIAMPWLIYEVAGGFADRPETLDLATLYARITFPYLLLISLTAFFGGLLNALGRFAAASPPVILNLCLIGGVALAHREGIDAGSTLSWAVPVAGVLHLLLVVWVARRAGLRVRLRRPRADSAVWGVLAKLMPAVLASGVHQINLVVGTLVASFFRARWPGCSTPTASTSCRWGWWA